MKPLDKALLTQELSQLITSLQDDNLSYFDHARAKQRILEIQQLYTTLLHQPGFQDTKDQLEPLLQAQEFVYHCHYSDFCCGTFSQDQELEEVLYQQTQSTWALLYEPEEGWQIWLLQMPNQKLLISENGALEEVYHWLVTQELKYQCFGVADPQQSYTASTTIHKPSTQAADIAGIDDPISTTLDATYQAHMHKIEKALHIPIHHFPNMLEQATTQQIQGRVLQETRFDSGATPQPVSTRRLRKQEIDISEGLSFDLGLEPLQLDSNTPIHIPPLFTASEPTMPYHAQEPTFDLIDFNTTQTQSNSIENSQAISALSPTIDPSLSVESSPPKAMKLAQNVMASEANLAQTQAVDFTAPPEATSEPDIQVNLAQKMIISAKHSKKPQTRPNLLLNGYSCQVSALLFDAAQEKQLYRLNPEDISCNHVDLLLHYTDIEHVFERPIYLAEQTDSQGRFVKYLALFGAVGELQAIRLAHIFSHAQEHKLAAVSSINWASLEKNLFDPDALFNTYQALATLLWDNNHYYPFIPAHFLQTQKFIQFVETPAHVNTPLLLLKERQKIRVIHGDQRLGLYRNETAYPYLLLDRNQGISWQMIQEVIQRLPQPIDPITLYKAICTEAS
ncbi:hypothetical protein [uncultured Acinetobacter sp.]|uniref:hypothetical protein n=1 Tax=uncultured Acinetobacter sp. TaxID=165433 RepID=UPI0026335A3B|nr:hypothetical protein [uncultured Acinetobacter sp.]